MTDRELVDAAWNELEQTNITFTRWRNQGFTPGHWANAKAYLDRVGVVPTPIPVPTGLPSPINSFCFFKLGSPSVGNYPGLDRYGFIITDANGIDAAKPLAGPCLTYTNCAQVVSDYSQGFTYAQAKAGNWLLGNIAGTTTHWVLDHTNQAMNDAQAEADCQYCLDQGADGIYLDDTIPMNPYGFGGVTSTVAYRDGVVYYVHKLRDLLHTHGKVLYCNYNSFADPSLGSPDSGDGDVKWASMIAPDGVLQEGFAETRDGHSTLRSAGANWNQLWDKWETVPQRITALGINYIPLSYNTGGNHYTWASFLLIYEPPMSFTYPQDLNGTYVKDPGAAQETKTQVGLCWRRKFANFTVYVNPTLSPQTADGHSIPAVSAIFV